MKDPYVNPGEDDSLDAAQDAENALDTEFITLDDNPVDEEDEGEEDKEDDDELEDEGYLPEDYDPDADDQEQPGD